MRRPRLSVSQSIPAAFSTAASIFATSSSALVAVGQLDFDLPGRLCYADTDVHLALLLSRWTGAAMLYRARYGHLRLATVEICGEARRPCRAVTMPCRVAVAPCLVGTASGRIAVMPGRHAVSQFPRALSPCRRARLSSPTGRPSATDRRQAADAEAGPGGRRAAPARSGRHPVQGGRQPGRARRTRPAAHLLRARPRPHLALERLSAAGRQDPGLRLPPRPPAHPAHPRPRSGSGGHRRRTGHRAQRGADRGDRARARLRARPRRPRQRGGVHPLPAGGLQPRHLGGGGDAGALEPLRRDCSTASATTAGRCRAPSRPKGR